MYRIGLENILGFTKHGETLTLEPCVPASWREFSIEYRFGASVYLITVRRRRAGGEVVGLTVDGVDRPDGSIPLVDDGARHEVLVDLG